MPPQHRPQAEIKATDANVGRLLSQLIEYYPGAQKVLSMLHAMPTKIEAGLIPDPLVTEDDRRLNGPLNLLGQFARRPTVRTIQGGTAQASVDALKQMMSGQGPQTLQISRFLDEPSARFTTMHESSHAMDTNFGLAPKLSAYDQGSPDANRAFLEQWQKAAIPTNFQPGQNLEHRADFRAAHALGLLASPQTAFGTEVLRQERTPQASKWVPGQPVWPQLQHGQVDDTFLRRILGDALFERVRAGQPVGNADMP